MNLNGLWDLPFARGRKPVRISGRGKSWCRFVWSRASQGRPVRYPGPATVVSADFRLSRTSPGGRLLVHFEAVDWQATVWINGQTVGQHSGGYDRSSFDVTDFVRPGETSWLSPCGIPPIPVGSRGGKQVLKPHGIWYTAVTGIWQTVWLNQSPPSLSAVYGSPRDVDHQAVQLLATPPAVLGCRPRLSWKARRWPRLGAPVIRTLHGYRSPEPRQGGLTEPTLYDLKLSFFSKGPAG